MKDELIEMLVADVLKRLLPQMGANGSRGPVIVVFTGATVGSAEAIAQLRALILGGFELQLVFSEMAEHIYGLWVREQLAGFPYWSELPPVTWLRALRDARAVLVPLMSVNSLSKLSLLIADNQAGNLMLHGLFAGKPVIIARNGFEAETPGRAELGFNKGRQELTRAVDERARVVADYGCVLVDIRELNLTTDAVLAQDMTRVEQGFGDATDEAPARIAVRHERRLITAGDVLEAHRQKADLSCDPTALMTPLARDLAAQHGVCILRYES